MQINNEPTKAKAFLLKDVEGGLQGFIERADAPGLYIQRRFRADLEFEKDHTIELLVEMSDTGRPEISEFVMRRATGLPPITNADLRRVNLARLFGIVIAQASLRLDANVEANTISLTTDPGPSVARRVHNRITPQLLAEVAEEWNSGPEGTGTARVRERWLLSERTASRWVTLARRAGLIEAAAR